MRRADEIGLRGPKDARISGRVSLELIERAKARTGLAGDTELLEFALANVAVEDDFLVAFDSVAGRVDPGLDLES